MNRKKRMHRTTKYSYKSQVAETNPSTLVNKEVGGVITRNNSRSSPLVHIFIAAYGMLIKKQNF